MAVGYCQVISYHTYGILGMVKFSVTIWQMRIYKVYLTSLYSSIRGMELTPFGI